MNLRSLFTILSFFLFSGITTNAQSTGDAYILVLGVAQDGGYPHMGCTKKCCEKAWKNETNKRHVVSLALVDPKTKKWWLFEATPDIKEQLHYFASLTHNVYHYLPDGIFITHAHIGHYTGLIQLGREVMNTRQIPVYTLPRLKKYIEINGPWSQLVSLENITLRELTADVASEISENVSVTAFTVPHRDEYSETAGFRIHTSGKNYLFIPDINKWDKWQRDIKEEVKKVDVALVDATFYSDTELPGRNMSEVPHPFVAETMDIFKKTDKATRSKVTFIHMNHTNPLLWDHDTQQKVLKQGYHIATQGEQL